MRILSCLYLDSGAVNELMKAEDPYKEIRRGAYSFLAWTKITKRSVPHIKALHDSGYGSTIVKCLLSTEKIKKDLEKQC